MKKILLTVLLSIFVFGCTENNTPVAPEVVPNSGNTTTRDASFLLRAYDLDEVYLTGVFNSWVPNDPAYAMTLDPDGYTWRLTTAFPTGLQQYKFSLYKGGSNYLITDPAAVEVISGSDPAQANALIGRTLPEISELAEPIQKNKLVIYEASINDLTQSATFASTISALTTGANLVDLGVNAIEFLPVTAPSYNGWGYDPVLYNCVSPHFGWPNFFAMMVDRFHDENIAVILDVVFNHAAGGCVLRQLDLISDQYHFTTTESNPWGMVELNWSDPALREHILDSLIMWVETYKIDGFRFDYVEGEGWSTWEYIRDEMRTRYPDVLLIGEDYRYPDQGNSVTHGYDAQWGGNHTDSWGGGGNNFLQVMTTCLTQNGFATRGQTNTTTGAWGSSYRNMWAVANVLSGNSGYNGFNGDGFSDGKYLESHDENRIPWSVDNYGLNGAPQTGGLQKAKLGVYALFTSIGIPMLFNGQEIGCDEYREPLPAIFKPDWDNGNQELRTMYKSLIDLRLSSLSLQSEDIFFHWRDSYLDQYEYTVCYWRGPNSNSADAEIVVALNFDNYDHTFWIPFPENSTWMKMNPELGTWEAWDVSFGGLEVTIPASSGILWKKHDGISSVW